MNKKELKEIEKYFENYSNGEYHPKHSNYSNKICGRWYHKEESEFKIVIFENDELYQLNSDHEIQGVELDTLDALKIRFKSFTGNNIENINENI
jgi:hypothetical protein